MLQNNGSTLFVVADMALDCKKYNKNFSSLTWEKCTLRSWLDGSFYNTVFCSHEQSAIVPQAVVNEDNPKYGTEGGKDTNDKVYLLSIEETTNADYGFCSDAGIYSASRWMQFSPYAHARGIYTREVDNTGENSNCCWFLRSPGEDTIYAAYVYFSGDIYQPGIDVGRNSDGCVRY